MTDTKKFCKHCGGEIVLNGRPDTVNSWGAQATRVDWVGVCALGHETHFTE